MTENFDYKLNPAYCLYRGIAIEEQNGSNISFYVADKKIRKTVKKGFYDFVDYVRTLNECPPEYNKRPTVKFKYKKRDEIEQVISSQIMNLYTPEQFVVIEKAYKENNGLVVISSEEHMQSYDDYLHLKFIENPNSYFEKEFWSVEGKIRIRQKLKEGKLVFVEMARSSVFEVMKLLVEGGILSDELIRCCLRCIIIQENHSFSGGEDLLADVAVFRKKSLNKIEKKFDLMSEEEMDNCFTHFTNFGKVLHKGMDRLFDRGKKGLPLKKSALGLVLGMVFIPLINGCCVKNNNFEIDSVIKKEFINTCLGNGYASLNEWQKVNRKKFMLDYIGWSRAEDFVVDNCSIGEKMPLYYGCWKKSDSCNNDGMEEIYCRSKFLKNQEKINSNQLKDEFVPYEIDGSIEKNIRNINFDYKFTNKSSKDIKSYTIVFYLFDMDGNAPETLRNNVVKCEYKAIQAYSWANGSINLDDLFEVIPDEEYTADFLYVSKIEFADETEWTDPFGMKYFR